MQIIISYFWRICLFRIGPEEMPNSYGLTGLICGLYLISSSLSILIAKPSLGIVFALLAALSTLLIIAATLYLLLKLNQHPERFIQGFNALLGCNVMILVISAPLSLAESQLAPGIIFDLVNLSLILFIFWWISISGFILSRTTDLGLMLSIAMAYVLEILQVLSINELFIAPLSTGV